MRLLFTLALVIVLVTASGQTRLYILGTVHNSTKNYTADSILNILIKLQPDLILQELDSSFFTAEFKLKKELTTNESIGVKKYISTYPTPVRPYEISGRNEYYRAHNTFKLEKESADKLKSIKKKLDSKQKRMYSDFLKLNKRLGEVGEKTPFQINQSSTYDLVEKRQGLMYKGLLTIYESREELSDFREFYKENGDFWDRRNKAMAKNIISFIDMTEFKNKTIVVLTGFYHKYYLLNELRQRQEEHKFVIKEYYE